MWITIKGKKIQLDEREVHLCREQIARIINSVNKSSKKGLRRSYYFTFLIMMHIMSQNALDELDPENFALIMKALHKQ